MEIQTKLIDVTYIKNHTVVQQLVNEKEIDPFILLCQEHQIRPILGDTLYNNVINEVNANSGSTSGLTSTTIQTLVDQLQPCLAYYTLAESVPYMSYKLANNGAIQRTGGGNFVPVEDSTVKFIKSDLLGKAKLYANSLDKFLKDNKDTYYPTDENTTINKKSLGGFYF